MKIYLDGRYVDKNDAKISVFDHGLLYGDGVFEGIRAYNGKVFKLKEHITRLYESARAIKLEIPMSFTCEGSSMGSSCRAATTPRARSSRVVSVLAEASTRRVP